MSSHSDDRKGSRSSSYPTCRSYICDLLRQLNNKTDQDDNSINHKQELLILTKGSSQPVSVDGMDPTIFTLEYFSSRSCLAEFSFQKEDIDSSIGITSVKGTFIIDCSEISGIYFLKKQNDDENEEDKDDEVDKDEDEI